MSNLLELPHTHGCLVCGPSNALGLKLSLQIDPATGIVHVDFSPRREHICFEGIAHGGMLATVFDEAMVWAATWNLRRFCVCGEFSVRFRRPATVGETLHMEAGDLLPVAEALQMLRFAEIERGDIRLTDAGMEFAKDDTDGVWLAWSYVQDASAKNKTPPKGNDLWGYDPSTKTYVRDKYDNYAPGVRTHMTSKGFAGDTVSWEGPVKTPKGDVPFKHTFKKLDGKTIEGKLFMGGQLFYTSKCTKQ